MVNTSEIWSRSRIAKGSASNATCDPLSPEVIPLSAGHSAARELEIEAVSGQSRRGVVHEQRSDGLFAPFIRQARVRFAQTRRACAAIVRIGSDEVRQAA